MLMSGRGDLQITPTLSLIIKGRSHNSQARYTLLSVKSDLKPKSTPKGIGTNPPNQQAQRQAKK